MGKKKNCINDKTASMLFWGLDHKMIVSLYNKGFKIIIYEKLYIVYWAKKNCFGSNFIFMYFLYRCQQNIQMQLKIIMCSWLYHFYSWFNLNVFLSITKRAFESRFNSLSFPGVFFNTQDKTKYCFSPAMKCLKIYIYILKCTYTYKVQTYRC